jgi:hypothetical protein
MASFGIANIIGRAPAKPNADVLMRRAEADGNKTTHDVEIQRRKVLQDLDTQRKKKALAAKAKNKTEFKLAHERIAMLERRLALMQGIEAKVEQANDANANNRLIFSAMATFKSTKESMVATAAQVKPDEVEDLVEELGEAIAEASALVDIVAAPIGDTGEDFTEDDMDSFLDQAAESERARQEFLALEAQEAARVSAAAAPAAPPPRAAAVSAAVAVEDTEHLRVAELLSALPVPSAALPTMTPAQAARAKALARN